MLIVLFLGGIKKDLFVEGLVVGRDDLLYFLQCLKHY